MILPGKEEPPNIATHDDLRNLIYMVRCAFSHNMATPIWKASGPNFARKFKLPLETDTEIDLSALNGKAFEYSHIGGPAQWIKTKEAAIQAIHSL